jgi:dTDP-4-amino-4,6-dideoxygalactose transaminase
VSERKPVHVTEPFLPPLPEFVAYLERIWQSKTLTNGGPFHQELEAALVRYLGVEHIALFNNATIALMTALRALRIEGEVITTPFSFVATAHSIVWAGCSPVFVDVDPRTLNLDPARIEAAITPRTQAIMPVHCYGEPCDVEAIARIASRHNLKIIYDAAHAFGVRDSGGSILRHGDLAVLSFHATKVFNTFEGGAIVCPDEETKLLVDQLKNFGIMDETTVSAVGLNGKMSEVHAAMGLLQLEHIGDALARRRRVDETYRSALSSAQGIRCMARSPGGNFAYFPVLVEDDYPLTRDTLHAKLKARGILSRRYFYPLISEMPVFRGSSGCDDVEVASAASRRVLCLPIHPGLSEADQARVIDVIRDC